MQDIDAQFLIIGKVNEKLCYRMCYLYGSPDIHNKLTDLLMRSRLAAYQ